MFRPKKTYGRVLMSIDDSVKLEEDKCTWSNKWNQSTVLAAESIIALDLLSTFVYNMKTSEEGKLRICVVYRKSWDLLIAVTTKPSQHSWDGGAIMSQMLSLKKKLKVEFDHANFKIKNDTEKVTHDVGNLLVISCCMKVKDKRIKCTR